MSAYGKALFKRLHKRATVAEGKDNAAYQNALTNIELAVQRDPKAMQTKIPCDAGVALLLLKDGFSVFYADGETEVATVYWGKSQK